MPSTAFAAPARRFGALAPGLRSGLSLHRPPEDPGLRCCPSSLYTFPARLLRAWLGIAISGFPEFGQFCFAGFPASTQVFLKSAASAIPPRPRGWSCAATYHRTRRLNLSPSLPSPKDSAKGFSFWKHLGRHLSLESWAAQGPTLDY